MSRGSHPGHLTIGAFASDGERANGAVCTVLLYGSRGGLIGTNVIDADEARQARDRLTEVVDLTQPRPMTLREAVQLAAMHGGTMHLTITGVHGGFAGYHDVIVSAPDDDGFTMTSRGHETRVPWNRVERWMLILSASGDR